MKIVTPFRRVHLKERADIESPGLASRSAQSGTPTPSARGSISCASNQAEARIYASMMARVAAWDIAGCGPLVPVARVEGSREGLEGLEVKAAGAVSDVVVAGSRRGCVDVDAVATGEAEVRPISVWSGPSRYFEK